MNLLQLIFLGAPGCGKGTQAKALISHGFTHISTGDLLRAEVEKGSALGVSVSNIMSSGGLVSDDIVFELLKSNCDLSCRSYIFDGFPRTFAQALALQEKVIKSSSAVAIYFDIDPEIVIERVVLRRTCSSCGQIYNLSTKKPLKSDVCDHCSGALVHRHDDQEEVVRNRITVYKNAIIPVINFYKDLGILRVVDASMSAGKITDVLKGIIKN